MVKDSEDVEADIQFYETWSIPEAETELNAVIAALENLHNILKDIENDEN